MRGIPEHVAPGIQTPTPAARDTQGTQDGGVTVVTASQPDEERTLVGIPFGCASGSEGVYGSEEDSG